MARAIELYFDPGLEAAIRSVWRNLAEGGLPSLPAFTHGRHRSHLTLTVAESRDLSAHHPSIANLVGRQPVPVALEHLALFPGGVLFAGVVPTAPILELHARLASLLRGARIDAWPHYVVGRWVPHVTLAMGLNADQVPAAVSLCYRHARLLEGRVEAVGSVDVDTGACEPIWSPVALGQ